MSRARNAGINVARGNWLGFVDSDDYDRPYLTVKKCFMLQCRLGRKWLSAMKFCA
ncbi:MAG: glycosyltransferase [Faecalibacterium sp.]